jgi:hypothetical protein
MAIRAAPKVLAYFRANRLANAGHHCATGDVKAAQPAPELDNLRLQGLNALQILASSETFKRRPPPWTSEADVGHIN